MSGTLKFKIVLKKDFTRSDGTNAVYLQIYQDGRRVRIPLELSVPSKYFDDKRQVVKKGHPYAEEYNLLLGKVKADLNKILVNYRLSNTPILLDNVVQDMTKPSLRANFNEFASLQLSEEKGYKIMGSTHRQQKGVLSKIRKFQDPILFSEIDQNFIDRLKKHCAEKLGNNRATVESTIKTLKKYIHLANKKGIQTPIRFEDIKVKRMLGSRTFLTPEELKRVYSYYNSDFITSERRCILQRYLFSCFTGLRISDIEQLSHDHLFGDHLGLPMKKTKKFIRIKLNKVALSLIGKTKFFSGNYSREHINRELKQIASTLGIRKRLYFHSARHTFATNFLISGGDVVNLQRLLGHSNIEQTMIYVHIVDEITDKQVDLLDDIIK